jgi:membrane-bound inhibitor of C-type lysozyme
MKFHPLVLNFTGLNMIIQSNSLNTFAKLLISVALLTLVSACSTIKIPNPFSSDTKPVGNTPVNAIAYLCEGNKHFYVRMLNNGNDAWLIYPDHEVNLNKTSDGRYTSGVITLIMKGAETSLDDGEKIAYKACKVQAKN